MPKYKYIRTYVIEAQNENEALKKYYECPPNLRDQEYLYNLELDALTLADERKIQQHAQMKLDAVFRHTTLDRYYEEQELHQQGQDETHE